MKFSSTLLLISAPLLLSGAASAQVLANRAALNGHLNSSVVEDFESYLLGFGGAEVIGSLSLDENTITGTGQGPGLVLDGCTYSANSNSLQWDAQGYYGMPSQNLLSNGSDGVLTLSYDSPVSAIGFDMYAFSGFSDTTIVTVYNGSGAVIYTSGAISVPGPSPVFFGYTAASIGKVTIDSQVYSWSTLIDDHQYGGSSGPTLAKTGSCPGPMTVSATNCTPNAPVAFLYGAAGSYTKPAGTCAGVTLGISGPTLAAVISANGSGTATVNYNFPVGLCGKTVQIVDIATCSTSNTIVL